MGSHCCLPKPALFLHLAPAHCTHHRLRHYSQRPYIRTKFLTISSIPSKIWPPISRPRTRCPPPISYVRYSSGLRPSCTFWPSGRSQGRSPPPAISSASSSYLQHGSSPCSWRAPPTGTGSFTWKFLSTLTPCLVSLCGLNSQLNTFAKTLSIGSLGPRRSDQRCTCLPHVDTSLGLP
jgi:hypothetical protein